MCEMEEAAKKWKNHPSYVTKVKISAYKYFYT